MRRISFNGSQRRDFVVRPAGNLVALQSRRHNISDLAPRATSHRRIDCEVWSGLYSRRATRTRASKEAATHQRRLPGLFRPSKLLDLVAALACASTPDLAPHIMCRPVGKRINWTICGHYSESVPTLQPVENCGGCGKLTQERQMIQGEYEEPCARCIQDGKYVRTLEGRWVLSSRLGLSRVHSADG